jgi:hypothetical protein
MQEERSWAPIADVAAAYGVSVDTIRRKMKRGELDGRREQTPQGFRWLAPLPDAIERKPSPDTPGSPQTNESPSHDLAIVQRGQEELIETLRHELAIRNREISRLHDVIASQAQALQLTAGSSAGVNAHVPEPDAAVAPADPEPIEQHAELSIRPDATAWERVRRWVRGSPR